MAPPSAEDKSSRPVTPVGHGRWLTSVTAAGLAQLLLLVLAGWVRRHALNPDGVAYLRIAGYYAHGRTDLALSGYWGPLLSWLMTPLLAVGLPPLLVARLVMALTAVFFLKSCLAVFRAFELPEGCQRLGAWIAVVLSVCWSVENITPDLLSAALVGYAVCCMIRPGWHEKLSLPVWAGILWGLAFLAKAAALPLALLVTTGMAFAWWTNGARDMKKLIRGALFTLLGIALFAGPWVATISGKYDHLTISRSAQWNHALVGPSNPDRVYPMDRGWHEPEAGRVTFWEDPDLPYTDWSPLASIANAQRQLKVILRNVPQVVFLLTCICGLFPWLLVVSTANLFRAKSWRMAVGQRRWVAWLLVGALGAMYLPDDLVISEQRYFYATFPFLFVLYAGIFLGTAQSAVAPRPGRWRVWVVALAFLAPTLARPTVWRPPGATAGDCAWTLAKKLSALGISGPVASSAQMHGGRAGLYVAFHLGTPWYGDANRRENLVAQFEKSHARLVVVNRNLSVCEELSLDPNYIDLDFKLFGSLEVASQFPLKAYELRPPRAGQSP